MTADAHHHHHEDAPDMAGLVHQSRHLALPLIAVASVLTVFHQEGLAFVLGAIAAWLLAFWGTIAATMHHWTECSSCDQPPRALATPEARLKIARSLHSYPQRKMRAAVLTLTGLVIVLPKPYLDFWWGKTALGLLLFTTGAVMHHIGRRGPQHQTYYQAECPDEKCRAGLKKQAGRVPMWRGHYGPWLLLVSAPATCVLGILAMHHGIYWQGAYGLALLWLATVVMDMTVPHITQPCVHCLKHLPTNGSELAEKRMRWLRVFHQWRYRLPVSSGVIWACSWVVAGTVAAKIAVAVAVLLLLPWAALSRIHGRVKPWCPWCRDDDGDEDRESTPDPSTSQPAPV